MLLRSLHADPRFNPLPSCEGRRSAPHLLPISSVLQSTSLLRGKTQPDFREQRRAVASIHFPLAREDFALIVISDAFVASIHFPLAREDVSFPLHDCIELLQSTSLLRGKTFFFANFLPCIHASIHFPLAREDFNDFL